MKKMMSILTKSMLLATTLIFFTACDKDNSNPTPEPPKPPKGPFTVEIVPVADAGKGTCTYFSFAKNEQVVLTNENAASDLSWDIAFLGLSARTNGGVSGNGKARVFRTNTKDFDKIVSAAPYIAMSNLWETDRVLSTYVFNGTMPPPAFSLGLNPLFVNGGWYNINMSSMPPKITLEPNVYILQTAQGKYVKLQFLDVKGKDGTLGKVQFRYDFIAETGENAGVTAIVREGEVVISKEGKLSELLTEKEAEETLYLTIEKKTVTQADLDFMKKKMPKVQELNLMNATLGIVDGEVGFRDNKSLRKLILPLNQEQLGLGHFGYTKLEEVVIPGDKLVRVGEGAFSFSEKLKKVKLPNSVEIVEKNAFFAAKSLEYIEFPPKVILIPETCCYYCINLKSVVFKGEVKSLGKWAFDSCNELTSLKFMQKKAPTYGTWPFMESKYWADKDGKPRVFIYVPKGCTSEYLKTWNFSQEDAVYFKEF